MTQPTTRKPLVNPTGPLTDPAGGRGHRLRLLAALLASFVGHSALLGLFFLLLSAAATAPAPDREPAEQMQLDNTPVEDEGRNLIGSIDVDHSGLNPGEDIGTESDRLFTVTIPGRDDPSKDVGRPDGTEPAPPFSIPAPPGFGPGPAVGGTTAEGPGPAGPDGPAGGGSILSDRRAHPFPRGDSAATRDRLLKRNGGTTETEAAVFRGLKWLARQQSPDGRWLLDGAFKDKGGANDTAGTGFGLLPFLAAGKTHRPKQDNPFDKPIEKALAYLIRKQDRKTGNLGGGMYGHGIATIALCEAYGMTQDPYLRRPAQLALNYIVTAQHDAGGWRYTPGQAGDTSVSGWQIMALKSGQMAGLDVPTVTLAKAQRYLDSCGSADEGYGYTGPGSTPTLSAVGLLCRQFVQGWGPRNPRLIKGIDNHLKTHPPGTKRDSYYYYYSTQVLFHFGGDAWKAWNEKMRDALVRTQENDPTGPNFGSWSSAGDAWGSRGGGRLMVTALNLLTLEVYYRYLPLYYREQAAKNDSAGR